MSLNKNEKVGIKNNNYAYVLNIPKKVCQNYGSSNHLTHLCQKPVNNVHRFNHDNFMPLKQKGHPFYDKFDFMPCNVNFMTT